MNLLDIVIILLLIFAVWEGWRQGVVTQVLGLAALALGIFLAWKFGHSIGTWLGMEDMAATVVGFIIVLVAVIVGVVLMGWFTRGLFKVVGLGMFDNLLGVLFSCLKMFAIIGLVLMLFDAADPNGKVITDGAKNGSAMYRAVDSVNGVVFPFVENLFK